MNSILVLEDDRELNNIIYHSLMKENYRVLVLIYVKRQSH